MVMFYDEWRDGKFHLQVPRLVLCSGIKISDKDLEDEPKK